MALYSHESPCAICRHPVGTGAIVSFPPFVTNRNDPLGAFSDSVVHRACLDAHPLRPLALCARGQLEGPDGVGGLRCVACGETLRSVPGKWFGTWLLSSESHSPLFEFNYVWLHSAHFPEWDRASYFQSAVEEAMRSESWEGSKIVFDPLPSWTWDASGTPVSIDWGRRRGPKR
jgi:hypothetical protein